MLFVVFVLFLFLLLCFKIEAEIFKIDIKKTYTKKCEENMLIRNLINIKKKLTKHFEKVNTSEKPQENRGNAFLLCILYTNTEPGP